MERVKLGIIGCGIAAKKLHWPALKLLSDKFEITCVCNHTEPKAKEFAQRVGGVEYVLNYKDLLARDDVEAVDIMLPICLNYQAVKDSLQAQKHVIVEKPLAGSLEQAEQMVEFESEYPGLVMMVAENFRYHPVFQNARQKIEAGHIGPVHSVFWNNFMYFTQSSPYTRTQWRLDHEHIGGFVVDGGVHNMAVIRDLFGDVTCGRAFIRQVNPAIGKMDCMSLQFETETGIAGVFNDYFTANGFQENRLVIIGREGTLTIEADDITLKRHGEKPVQETVESMHGYREELENFHAAIREGQKVVSTFYEAYKDFEVLAKAILAAQKGESFRIEN